MTSHASHRNSAPGEVFEFFKPNVMMTFNEVLLKKLKISPKILATFRNNPYLCSVKCMFGYPGRIPRGASLIDNALGARHHDTTPFLKPSPQGMVFYRSYAFLNIWKNASPIVIWRITEIRIFFLMWSFGHGHLVIFDFGNAVIAHYI